MIIDVLRNYDLRLPSGLELRAYRYSWDTVYTLSAEGLTALSRFGDEGFYELLAIFTMGMEPESIGGISVVSSNVNYRYRRNRKAWIFPEEWQVENDSLEPYESADDNRYLRSKETVSDLLPDYHVAIGDLFPELFPEYQDMRNSYLSDKKEIVI